MISVGESYKAHDYKARIGSEDLPGIGEFIHVEIIDEVKIKITEPLVTFLRIVTHGVIKVGRLNNNNQHRTGDENKNRDYPRN